MQPLPRVAERTRRQVGFVVASHLRSQSGNVVAPTSEDLPDDRVSALRHETQTVAPSALQCAITEPQGEAPVAPPAGDGFAESYAARRAHVRPSSAQSQDDYSSLKDALK